MQTYLHKASANFQSLNPSGSLGDCHLPLHKGGFFSFPQIFTSVAGAAGADTARLKFSDSLDKLLRGITVQFQLQNPSCRDQLYKSSIKFFWFFSFKKRTRVPFHEKRPRPRRPISASASDIVRCKSRRTSLPPRASPRQSQIRRRRRPPAPCQ